MYVQVYSEPVSLRISPYLVQMRENTDQKNYNYGHFSRNVCFSELCNWESH